MKLHEGLYESVGKYHHWISQLKYMHFDTQYVEIGLKLAEIAKIVWICEKLREGVCESITIEFLSLSIYILIPNMLILAKKWLK